MFAIGVLFLASAPARAQEQPPPPEQPTFVSRADVVLVDVTVITSNGEPVADLMPADFKLTVNGEPRPVHTAQFISSGGLTTVTNEPRLANVSSNEQPSTGRLLVIAIDENYLRMGSGRAVLQTAERLLDDLPPGDLVALARLPSGRGSVEFTTDRARIRRALSIPMGGQPMRSGLRVRLSEAHAYDMRDQNTWTEVIIRECGSESQKADIGQLMSREECANELGAQATLLLTDAMARTRSSIEAFELLVARLGTMKAPANIVLISEGLFLGRDRGDLTHLARLAAEARATFHVVQPDETMFDADSPRGTSTMFYDSSVAEGLEQLAGMTRGSYFRAATSGAGAFDRIRRELSGYYLVSFEPTEADRNSQNRRIKVDVGRRGVTVKARSTYAVVDAEAALEAAMLEPEAHVKSLLTSPLPTAGLPMRVATYSVSQAEGGAVRVVLSAEIGEAADNAVDWPIGMLVFNNEGKVFLDSTQYMKLEPATDRTASPRLLTLSMVLNPGEYTLRLAALDHNGTSGSVHHTIDARLHRLAGGAVRAGDLIVSSELTPSGAPRPMPTATQYSEMMYSILELASEDERRIKKSEVTVEVAESESAATLVSAEAKAMPRGPGQLTYIALLKLGVLPPGDYVARAVVRVPGEEDSVVTRSFRLAPVALETDASPITARVTEDEAPAPLPMSKISAPVAAFEVDDVLTPDVVRPHLEFLRREYPVSAANEAVVAKAQSGDFEAPAPGPDTPKQDEIALAFIRGLAALQQKQHAQAAAWFQLSLRGASDFLGAALYLGAVHAAAGRDNDAIGAWQMATISDDSAAAYPMLVDAMLRIGDAQGALDMIAEAPQAWASDDARLRRVATAQAMLGQFGPALETLDALLLRQPDDGDLLFVAIQVLYRQHLARPLSGPDRVHFDDYSKRYLDSRGPDAALVEAWRKYVQR